MVDTVGERRLEQPVFFLTFAKRAHSAGPHPASTSARTATRAWFADRKNADFLIQINAERDPLGNDGTNQKWEAAMEISRM
jgi:hypothetical protein